MAASVSFDSEEPTVIYVSAARSSIDDATALGAFDEPHCWVHWVMLIGVLLTVGYAAVVVANRLGYARRIDDFNNSLTSTVATETEDTRAARVAHKAGAGAAGRRGRRVARIRRATGGHPMDCPHDQDVRAVCLQICWSKFGRRVRRASEIA